MSCRQSKKQCCFVLARKFQSTIPKFFYFFLCSEVYWLVLHRLASCSWLVLHRLIALQRLHRLIVLLNIVYIVPSFNHRPVLHRYRLLHRLSSPASHRLEPRFRIQASLSVSIVSSFQSLPTAVTKYRPIENDQKIASER